MIVHDMPEEAGCCLANECAREVHAKGLCKTHYNRVLKGYPPEGGSARKRPTECSFDGCGRRSTSRGLCASHAWQRNRGHELTPIVPITAKACSYEGCDRAPQSRGRWSGLCGAHARQMRTIGAVQPIRDPRPLRAPEKFWESVAKRGTGCWEWTSNVSPAGYGTLNLGDGKFAYAHRYAWELLRSPIPEGLTIDHLCRNTRCVNPDHLEPVTQAENNRRAREHKRRAQQ